MVGAEQLPQHLADQRDGDGRRVVGDLGRQLSRGREQRVRRDDATHQAPGQGFLGGEHASRQRPLGRLTHADEARQEPRAARLGHDAAAGEHEPDAGRGGRDAHVHGLLVGHGALPRAILPDMSEAADAIEQLHARGVTDGLPVVPPTRALVDAMIAASDRRADELIASVAPANGRATIEKIAINAVMAGCRPEYMPVVVAAVRAMCDDAFDLVGISGTTDAVAPIFIVNGPARVTIELNCAAGALGPGTRANATIGRALRLIWANLGGARPGVISMSTFGNPARYACCFGEHEEASPWEPLHVEHGFAPGESTVAAFPGEPLVVVADTQSRKAADVLATITRTLEVVGNHTLRNLGDVLIVFAPEHAQVIGDDGWSKADARDYFWERLRGKFRAPENFRLLVAGGTAGRFTALIPGWPFPNAPTALVLKKIG